ncbi:general transcription factor II-I repeat domain-containing protein 2-like isoform X2 [Melanotaenia boesemani]|uniref:general transcription factor II-I repeat domain-containing protein 2-like isoform X2 n=1 Tax=Melanotaenia boesemani TaxID=1250792 RepID=UPI001C03D5D3|nr:general transcription factor II-I repeat domain-containing protein 2-like isoform X2 [Melanotaenia boesemani]
MSEMDRGRQWHTDKRKFKSSWEHEYFFTEIDFKAVCLICKQKIAVLKEYNLRRHYETRHFHQLSKYAGEERKVKARDLLSKLTSQQRTLLQPSTVQESATRASYRISSIIVRSGRPFAVGDFVKQCLTVAAETVCPNQTRALSQISLSRNTLARRVEDMAEDVRGQIVQRASHFSAFSIACDESMDITDSAQLLVFIRGVNENFDVCQELAGLETLKGTTKGVDVFMVVQRVMDKNSLKWENLCGITTDRAPAMVGKRKGLTALVSDKVREFGGSLLKYHCILHQEQLCNKSTGLKNVMQDVIAIVNNIRSKALSHRQFRALLDEMDAQYGDVLYHQKVRWLSRGKVLRRFFELREEIRAFQATRTNNIQVPSDKHWISDLAFLVDITELLNILNLQLQGKDQIINQMYDHIRAFKQKLLLLSRHLSTGNLAHFSSLKEVGLMEESTPKYLNILSDLVVEFDNRFKDFQENSNTFELFAQPFSVHVDVVSEELQMELLELQSDSDLHSKSLQDFYRCVPAHRYAKICKHAQVMLSLFGSTYICEQAFRNSLSDSHVHDILTSSLSQLEPDVERLLHTKDRLHVSH